MLSRSPLRLFLLFAVVAVVLPPVVFAASPPCGVANCERCTAMSALLCESCRDGFVKSFYSDKCTAAGSGNSGNGNNGPIITIPTTTTTTTSPPGAVCAIPNCELCFSTDRNKCTRCRIGYAVSVSYRCVRATAGGGLGGGNAANGVVGLSLTTFFVVIVAVVAALR